MSALKFNHTTLTVIIPTFNEENNIVPVLSGLPDIVDEVLVVDGHSTDNTVNKVRELLPDANILFQPGRGKGDALRHGFNNAQGDIIVTIDADGSMDPAEIPAYIEPILNGYDYVKGSRFLPQGGTTDMVWYRKLANKMFVILVNVFYGSRYTDLCYGYNALHKRVLDKITYGSDGFEIETEMHIKAKKHNLLIAEVPSFEDKRVHGEGKLKTFSDGWRILKTILRERVAK
ncbi:MAG TPA: glycosyltransferase family 2 protein [Dehalococcoidia bacterium]|nr:glycosyltransferase family 2 protein [Dehalococcoidia bacterium]